MASNTSQQKIVVGVFGIPVQRDPISNQIKYLLTQRNEPGTSSHLKWQLAGGGMEFGETAEQTLARELSEEIGATAEILWLQPFVHTHTWPADSPTATAHHVVLLDYLVRLTSEIDLQKDLLQETADVGWFTRSEVTKLNTFSEIPAVLESAEKLITQMKILV
jgi:8-oxo-dGTP pyrophosphatase MutT (NUDIX family)